MCVVVVCICVYVWVYEWPISLVHTHISFVWLFEYVIYNIHSVWLTTDIAYILIFARICDSIALSDIRSSLPIVQIPYYIDSATLHICVSIARTFILLFWGTIFVHSQARNYMEFCATENFKNLQSSSRDLRELHTFQLMTEKNCRKNRAQKQSTTKQSFQFNGWNLEQITMERKTWPSSWIMKPIAVVQQQFEYAKSH